MVKTCDVKMHNYVFAATNKKIVDVIFLPYKGSKIVLTMNLRKFKSVTYRLCATRGRIKPLLQLRVHSNHKNLNDLPKLL
jgi:hypothetical protein